MKKAFREKEKEIHKRIVLATPHEHLREAAYYRWLERGSPMGEDLEDWYEVENKWRDNIVPTRND